MSILLLDELHQALVDAETLYHRLVLLVGESGSGKTPLLRLMAADLKINVINANLSLCTQLLELNPKQRALRLPKLLEKVIVAHANDNEVGNRAGNGAGSNPVIILDNIEILFDTTLRLDPLRLLQNISRNRTIVASWNGRVEGNYLLYAEVGHPEYRKYELGSFLVVPTEQK